VYVTGSPSAAAQGSVTLSGGYARMYSDSITTAASVSGTSWTLSFLSGANTCLRRMIFTWRRT